MKQRFVFNKKDKDILDLEFPEDKARILSNKINEGLNIIDCPSLNLFPNPRGPKSFVIRLDGKFITVPHKLPPPMRDVSKRGLKWQRQ